jgi:hypothetical protein
VGATGQLYDLASAGRTGLRPPAGNTKLLAAPQVGDNGNVNIKHLGDPIDQWKRAVFIALSRAGVIKRLRVAPMFTGTWNEKDVSTYATGVGVQRGDILLTSTFSRARSGATDYFAQVQGELRRMNTARLDLFVDPDTGIADPTTTSKDSSGAPKRNQRISHHEVVQLCGDTDNGALVVVYDQTCPNGSDLDEHSSSQCRELKKGGLSVATIIHTSKRLQLVVGSFDPTRLAKLDTVRDWLRTADLARVLVP